MTEVDKSSERAYGDLKSKRTESLPKHSLFGTTLETLTEVEKQQLRDLDINKFCNDIDKERRLRERRYKLTIPDHLQEQISGNFVIGHVDINHMQITTDNYNTI